MQKPRENRARGKKRGEGGKNKQRESVNREWEEISRAKQVLRWERKWNITPSDWFPMPVHVSWMGFSCMDVEE